MLIPTFTERALRLAVLLGTFTLTKCAGCSRCTRSCTVRRLSLRTLVLTRVSRRRGRKWMWREAGGIISRTSRSILIGDAGQVRGRD